MVTHLSVSINICPFKIRLAPQTTSLFVTSLGEEKKTLQNYLSVVKPMYIHKYMIYTSLWNLSPSFSPTKRFIHIFILHITQEKNHIISYCKQ